ncbi:MAG: cytochrome c biogenesis protein CcsA [Planctomycetes bacterium]|nr:cytochrome c biogenesis protein CcsA [Planctomycetota bacterium]
MRVSFAALIALVVTSVSTYSSARESEVFNWNQWRHLPVQEGGRGKPFDTLAWETLRLLSNRASFTDPETGQKLDANTFYLAILFDWQGWDKPADPHSSSGMPWRGSYFHLHQPDKWDRAPFVRVDFLALREALGMLEDQKFISPLDLSQAKIKLPGSSEERPFLRWAEELIGKQERGLALFEKKALELADKFWSYQDHRMGRRLEIIPVQGSEDREWLDAAQLMQADFDDTSDPSGLLRRVKQQFQQARTAYLADSATEFNAASASFITAVRELGPQLGPYPSRSVIDWEVGYNHWAPFRFSWVFTLLAFLCLLLSMAAHWKPFYVGGWVAFGAGLVAMCVGFALRVVISGRAPVTNMYESVIYLGLGVAAFGIVFELIYRRRYILTAAAALATVALILADNCPATLDPSLRPLEPVLRSNFWLVTHVMTITLSYATFALALGIGNITLGYFLVGSTNQQTIDSLTRFTYRAIQVGVFLLAAGTILGGVWADYSWGRFWGWDPKEVWALIALLGYLAVLHARHAGWVKDFGLAALSVFCFLLVVMAWYGVNFVLGAGLHSYGFGGGGQGWVFGAIALQTLFVAAAAIKFASRISTQSILSNQTHGA